MKAQGGDWLLTLVYVVVGGIGIFIALYILGAIHSGAPQIFNASTNPVGAKTYSAGSTAVNYLNTLLILIFVGAILASAISGSQVDTVPAFAFVGIVVLVVSLPVSFIFHNIYFDVIQNSAFGGLLPSTPTVIFFEYLPLLGLIGFFIIMFFTFGHGGSGSGGAGAYTH